MQERQRDGERGQSGDTEDSGLLKERVEDNVELERVDSVTVPQEDTTENAVGGKTEDMTNAVGQRNGEGGQTGDTKESVVILLSVGKTKGQRSKRLKRVAAAAVGCGGIVLLVGVAIFTANKYSAVKNNLTLSETNHNNLTLERESQANQPKNKSCPSGWKQFGDSCYYTSTEQNSWEKSREQCLEMGGPGAHLVVISNKEEQEFVGGLGNEGVAAWTGLRRIESIWTWVDGTTLTSQYWHSEYPVSDDDDANCTTTVTTIGTRMVKETGVM